MTVNIFFDIIVLILILTIILPVENMELKGTSSCQNPLLNKAKIITTSNTNPLGMNLNSWCPLKSDDQPSIHILLPNITFITALEMKSLSIDLEYRLEYTRETHIDSNTIWRIYRSLTHQQDRLTLDPPLIARHVRLTIQQMKSTTTDLCLQFDLFGCIFTDGVVSYNMLQGSNQLEDDTYDGNYDEKQHYLSEGLGQLSDGQTGPDNREDSGGFQWIGWRKPRSIKHNHSITILFNFDTLRNFSRLTIHANNYYPKNIFIFRAATIEFLPSSSSSSSSITYQHQHDDQFEMARAIMIDLKYHVASQLKVRLHFDGHWILISEMTFDSFIVPSSAPVSTPSTVASVQIEEKTIETHSSYQRWVYLIVSASTMAILLMLTAIIVLIRRTYNDQKKLRKHYFTPIHNQTHSSASTTSSDIDFNSSQHRYATIGPAAAAAAHPYLLCTNGSLASSNGHHYAKLMPTTTTLLRAPSHIQQQHIEGICGNSTYSTERIFNFDFNANQFIPMNQIEIKRKIECRQQLIGGGEIYQGEFQVNQSVVPIHIRRLQSNASVHSKISFFNEMSLLTSLCHRNILHAYGFCSEPSISLLTESLDLTSIDLYQYLHHYKNEQQMNETLYATTLFFGSQICSAMSYLESLHIYHRDLAARNCLVTLDLTIKLQDLAMCNETYADDYVLVSVGNDVKTRRPIRWCSWETICLNKFTSKSDVFSFGVLLWEILTMAERPHLLLDDEQVLENLRQGEHHLLIPDCALDLTDLIISCWNKCDYDRPSFAQIQHQFCQKQQL